MGRSKKSKRPKRPKSSKPKMRGGMLGRIASAFRLRRHIEASLGGTSRTGFNDQRDVGRHRHIEMIRTLVDGLFTAEYLDARGLDASDAVTHNDLVTHALDALLAEQDMLAVRENLGVSVHGLLDVLQSGAGITHEIPRHLAAFDGLVGIEREVALRLAAYWALYGYLHPSLASVPMWMKSKGLSGWWRDMARRARRTVVVKRLFVDHMLTEKTVHRIRKGDALPQETNVVLLAERLSGFGIDARDDQCEQPLAEVVFEIRLATAVAENGVIVGRLVDPQPSDIFAVELHAMRHLLADLPDRVLASLLRDGQRSAAWPAVEQGVRLAHVQHMWSLAADLKKEADLGIAELESNPSKALRAHAERLKGQVDALRAYAQRPGADGPELRLAEHLEAERHLMLLAASGGTHEPPAPRPQHHDELRADVLCMNATSPWTDLHDTERQKMLRDAVEVAPWLAYPRRTLADHLARTGEIDEAIEHYRAAIDLNPKNIEGRLGLAMLLVEGERWEEIAQLADEPHSGMLDAVRAWALIMLDQPDEAVELADGVLRDHPSHPLALRVLAEYHRRAGREAEAKKLERKADFFEQGVAPPGS